MSQNNKAIKRKNESPPSNNSEMVQTKEEQEKPTGMGETEGSNTNKDLGTVALPNGQELPPKSESLPLLVINDLLKVPLRFNIMFLLYNYERMGFTRLQKLLHTTPGNLDHHTKKLIDARWIVDTIVFSPRPLKVFKITQEGKAEFSEYVHQLQKIIKTLE